MFNFELVIRNIIITAKHTQLQESNQVFYLLYKLFYLLRNRIIKLLVISQFTKSGTIVKKIENSKLVQIYVEIILDCQ